MNDDDIRKINELFHRLWGKAHDGPDYNKKEWVELQKLLDSNLGHEAAEITQYNPNYGDDRMCKCGHAYYRHFDTYDEMFPCGCKYCVCSRFEE